MKSAAYVLVTPVRNEEATIHITIESVIRQTIHPREWVIVSDGSTDGTDDIVRRYAAAHAFIRLLRLDHKHTHSFAAVVFATEAGHQAIRTTDYDFIGLLDADVRFAADYYEKLIQKFAEQRRLGLAGGWVRDVVNGKFEGGRPNLREIAGATQFFRRACFESLGGLMPIPEGGWDAITCVRARMNGYETRTFPDLVMEHLKPRNAAFGNPVSRKWQMGIRDYTLASHPLFEAVKCLSHVPKSPVVIGAAARFAAFVTCMISGRKVTLPPDLARFVRQEQLARVLPFRNAVPASAVAAQRSVEAD
jgi:glycosyltransferase involved in cell wall biosynthesis